MGEQLGLQFFESGPLQDISPMGDALECLSKLECFSLEILASHNLKRADLGRGLAALQRCTHLVLEIRGSYSLSEEVTRNITESVSNLPLLRDCYISINHDSSRNEPRPGAPRIAIPLPNTATASILETDEGPDDAVV